MRLPCSQGVGTTRESLARSKLGDTFHCRFVCGAVRVALRRRQNFDLPLQYEVHRLSILTSSNHKVTLHESNALQSARDGGGKTGLCALPYMQFSQYVLALVERDLT